MKRLLYVTNNKKQRVDILDIDLEDANGRQIEINRFTTKNPDAKIILQVEK